MSKPRIPKITNFAHWAPVRTRHVRSVQHSGIFHNTHISSIHIQAGCLVDETESATKTSKLVAGLLLHQVETHGDQRQATHEVQTAHDVFM